MHAESHPRAVTDLVNRLVDALAGRGLVADPIGANIVQVGNRAADPPADDPLGLRLSPWLRQTVMCRPDRDGQLAWWWLWSAAGEGLEQEWLCPGMEITLAVNAIVRVLALRAAPDDKRTGA